MDTKGPRGDRGLILWNHCFGHKVKAQKIGKIFAKLNPSGLAEATLEYRD